MLAQRPLVAILSRAPEPGRSKTRLAAVIGEAAAARLAEAFLIDVTAQVASEGWESILFVEPASAGEKLAELTGVAETEPQADGSIGRRMAAAVSRCVERNAGAVVVVGSDIPLLNASRIEAALTSLAERDVVFGPARDGGYYLVALGPAPLRNAAYERLFGDDVPWSSEETLAASERVAQRAGWSVGRIATLGDVDTWEDLAALRADLHERPRSLARRTRRELASLEATPG